MTTEHLWWRAFLHEYYTGGIEAAAAWVDTQRQYQTFALLVQAADRKLADLRQGAA